MLASDNWKMMALIQGLNINIMNTMVHYGAVHYVTSYLFTDAITQSIRAISRQACGKWRISR